MKMFPNLSSSKYNKLVYEYNHLPCDGYLVYLWPMV